MTTTERPSSPPPILRSTTFDEFCSVAANPCCGGYEYNGYQTPKHTSHGWNHHTVPPPVLPMMFRSVSIEMTDHDSLDSGLLLPMQDDDDEDLREYQAKPLLKPRFQYLEFQDTLLLGGDLVLPLSLDDDDDGISTLQDTESVTALVMDKDEPREGWHGSETDAMEEFMPDLPFPDDMQHDPYPYDENDHHLLPEWSRDLHQYHPSRSPFYPKPHNVHHNDNGGASSSLQLVVPQPLPFMSQRRRSWGAHAA